MNTSVDYLLNKTLEQEIVKIRDEILRKLKNPEMFLFGSVAKGCYSEKSDIDLLVLIYAEI